MDLILMSEGYSMNSCPYGKHGHGGPGIHAVDPGTRTVRPWSVEWFASRLGVHRGQLTYLTCSATG